MTDISVIMPVRNGGRFLDQALASVRAQILQPVEVLVVDDASTDDTAEVLAKWRRLLPLTVLRQGAPVGTWRARDLAIRAASTELIAQLDADDVLMPDHLAALSAVHGSTPGLVAPGVELELDGQSGELSTFTQRDPKPDHQLGQLLVGNYLSIGTLFARAVYLDVGGYQACGCAEDWDLWIRMSSAGIPIRRTDKATYIHRMHRSNISSRVNRRLTDLEILKKYLRDCTDPRYRAIAGISMLQRTGLAWLPRAAGAPDGPRPVPDVGWLWRDDGQGEALRLYPAEGGEPLLEGRVISADGVFEVTRTGAALAELVGEWSPTLGGYLTTFPVPSAHEITAAMATN